MPSLIIVSMPSLHPMLFPFAFFQEIFTYIQIWIWIWIINKHKLPPPCKDRDAMMMPSFHQRPSKTEGARKIPLAHLSRGNPSMPQSAGAPHLSLLCVNQKCQAAIPSAAKSGSKLKLVGYVFLFVFGDFLDFNTCAGGSCSSFSPLQVSLPSPQMICCCHSQKCL